MAKARIQLLCVLTIKPRSYRSLDNLLIAFIVDYFKKTSSLPPLYKQAKKPKGIVRFARIFKI